MVVDRIMIVLIGVILLGLAFIVVAQYGYAAAALTALVALLVPSPVGQNGSGSIS